MQTLVRDVCTLSSQIHSLTKNALLTKILQTRASYKENGRRFDAAEREAPRGYNGDTMTKGKEEENVGADLCPRTLGSQSDSRLKITRRLNYFHNSNKMIGLQKIKKTS